ncbi:MAG TPA: PH domain-containing protein [Actinomycetota bacterium]
MGFPRRLLAENEELILDLRPHWWQLVGPALVTVLIVVAVAVALLLMPSADRSGVVGLAAGVAAVLLFLVLVLPRVVTWATTHFVLTSDRLIYRHGLIAKYSKEIPLERLNDVTFSQSFFERLIGAGDLQIESAGEHGQSTFQDIRRPEAVQLEIYRQMEANQQRMTGGGRPPSALEDLERLAALRDRGVITEAEFQRKKQDLLGRM